MEKESKMRKQKREKNGNGPLQDSNGRLPVVHKLSTKKPSKFSSFSSSSSSSAAVPRESPKGCLKKPSFSSKASCSSSSSRTKFQKMPNISFSRTADASKLLSKSKANEKPRKPFSQISKRDPPQRKNHKNIAKPICKNGRKSKLAPVPSKEASKFEKGPAEFLSKLNKNSQGDGPSSGNLTNYHPNSDEIYSPLEKFTLDPVNVEIDLVNLPSHDVDIENNNCSTAVKTPPVEASVSPNIQTQSRPKIPVLKPDAPTPIFYGAGHLVSGVTDRRKCRRRGSLKGGFEKVNLFHEKHNSIDGCNDLPIPMLAEASVRWVLSPCDEKHEDFDLASGEKASELVCADIGFDKVVNKKENRKTMLSPSNSNTDEPLPVSPTNVAYTSNLIGDNSALPISSFSGGNVIQTLNLNSGSDEHVGRLVRSKIDTIVESLNRVDTSTWDPPVFQENADESVSSSWVSSTALDNLALSRMKISWRDEPMGGISENDELYCCCLWSDEEADGSCGEKKPVSRPGTEGEEEKDSGDNEPYGSRLENGLCATVLDYEPEIGSRGKGKTSSNEAEACAESIFTDGDGLAASSDSDWFYCRESTLFQVGEP